MMRSRHQSRTPMSPDAYAGFLRLLLTPGGRMPKQTADVQAYIRHANQTEPLSAAARRALGEPTDRAA